MDCSQEQCDQKAFYTYIWPGQGRQYCCHVHEKKVRYMSNLMDLNLEINEINTVNIILYCPRCKRKHIDEPSDGWDNPPHKTHLCRWCGLKWKPANICTNGVDKL